MVARCAIGFYHRAMLHDEPVLRIDNQHTRVVTLVLPESEWRALRVAEPDAVGWLQSQIRNRLAPLDGSVRPAAERPQEFSLDDDY